MSLANARKTIYKALKPLGLPVIWIQGELNDIPKNGKVILIRRVPSTGSDDKQLRSFTGEYAEVQNYMIRVISEGSNSESFVAEKMDAIHDILNDYVGDEYSELMLCRRIGSGGDGYSIASGRRFIWDQALYKMWIRK